MNLQKLWLHTAVQGYTGLQGSMGVARTHQPSVLEGQQLTAHEGYQKRERIFFKGVVLGRLTMPFLLRQGQPKLDSVNHK